MSGTSYCPGPGTASAPGATIRDLEECRAPMVKPGPEAPKAVLAFDLPDVDGCCGSLDPCEMMYSISIKCGQ